MACQMYCAHSIVPEVFTTSVIVPIIKKPTLDANSVDSYRPISLSSVFSKIIELLIYPTYTTCDTQFGFQKGKGTSFAACFINDLSYLFTGQDSPVFLCSFFMFYLSHEIVYMYRKLYPESAIKHYI